MRRRLIYAAVTTGAFFAAAELALRLAGMPAATLLIVRSTVDRDAWRDWHLVGTADFMEDRANDRRASGTRVRRDPSPRAVQHEFAADGVGVPTAAE